jgi:hypothetical protein
MFGILQLLDEFVEMVSDFSEFNPFCRKEKSVAANVIKTCDGVGTADAKLL